MKKIAIYISLGAILLSLAGYFSYRMGRMETSIRSRAEDLETFRFLNARLRHQNKKLKTQNRIFQTKLKRQKEAFAEYVEDFRKRYVRRLQTRVVNLERESFPYLGVPVIVASTFEEIGYYCEEMERVKRLEKKFFGFESEEEGEPGFCEKDSNETMQTLYESSLKALSRYRQIEESGPEKVVAFWKEWIDEEMESRMEIDETLEKRYLLRLYENLLDELNVTSELKEPLKETINYWRSVFGLKDDGYR
ncbi:hypothetical protein [Hydrogenimonas sp.]